MVTIYAGICNLPFPGCTLGGWLDFTRKAMHFRSVWLFSKVDIVINYRDIKAVYPCTHLLVIPAVEIHLVCGTVYKFQSVFERGYIIEALHYMMR